MNKIIFAIVFLFVSASIYAQINFVSAKSKDDTIMERYDSLSNIQTHLFEGKQSYKHLIGQTLVYAYQDHSDMSRFKKNGHICSKPEIGSKFEVLDVLPKGMREQSETLLLRGIEDGNSYTCTINNNSNYIWVVLGYYEKVEKTYVGQTYVYKDAFPYFPVDKESKNGIIKFSTDEAIVDIRENTVWSCSGIAIKERSGSRDSWFLDKRCPIVLIFENEEYGKCYCYIEDGTGNFWGTDKKSLFLSKFESYDIFLSEKNKKKQAEIKKEVERKKREERLKAEITQKEKERKIRIESAYGEYDSKLILAGKVRIGMTKDMCREAWGDPNRINTTITINGTSEQWVYERKGYLYFIDGKLTSIQY